MTTTHRITTTAAVLLSLAAAGAPAASARPADFVPARPAVTRRCLQPSRQDGDSSEAAGGIRRRYRPSRTAAVVGTAGASARRRPFRLQGRPTRGLIRRRRYSRK